MEELLETVPLLRKIPTKENLNAQEIIDRLRDKNYEIYIAREISKETKIVGAYVWYEENKEEAYFWLGSLDEDYRGNGLTSIFVSYLLEMLKSRGFRRLKAKTHLDRTEGSNRLMRKMGFEVEKIEGERIYWKKDLQ